MGIEIVLIGPSLAISPGTVFSIVIPTFNAGATLENALDSICSQSYQDFEVLVMDGGSTDNTVSIARTYNKDKVKIISQEDHGLYDAMNKGIALASGSWLFFLGSDDALYDNRVLEDVAAVILRPESPDVVYGNVHSSLLGDDYDGPFDREKLLKRNICHQAIFYHRHVFERIGFYNTKYSYVADYDLNVRCFYDSTLRIVHMPRRIALYHSEGMSSKLVRFYREERDVDDEIDFTLFKQALRERYLMLQTLRQVGVGGDYLERGMEKQAKRLIDKLGVAAALLGALNPVVRKFSRYDNGLSGRVRRLAWKSIRRAIRNLV